MRPPAADAPYDVIADDERRTPYRELSQDDKDEIYNRYNQGDIIMVNYPTHAYHKRIARVRNDGVDSDGDLRVMNLIKLSEEDRDWFYVHFTRAVILKRI